VALRADVANEAEARDAGEARARDVGRLDILVNNAA